jgi:hypothetical protein
MNYPTCDEKGNCLYCGDPVESCWCGAKHICLDCRCFPCACKRHERDRQEIANIISKHIAGNPTLVNEIAEDLRRKFYP